MKVDTLNRLRRNALAMIRWICNVTTKDEVSSDSFLSKLGIQDLDVVLRTSRIRCFGHVEHCTCWIAEVRKLNVVARKRHHKHVTDQCNSRLIFQPACLAGEGAAEYENSSTLLSRSKCPS